MEQEIFSKAEVLHHFENLMPRNNQGRAKYVGNSNFLATCAKQGLIKLVSKKVGYIFLKNTITKSDIDGLISALKVDYNKYKQSKKVKPSIDLDTVVKEIAASGLYRIENGKAYKKSIIWTEL